MWLKNGKSLQLKCACVFLSSLKRCEESSGLNIDILDCSDAPDGHPCSSRVPWDLAEIDREVSEDSSCFVFHHTVEVFSDPLSVACVTDPIQVYILQLSLLLKSVMYLLTSLLSFSLRKIPSLCILVCSRMFLMCASSGVSSCCAGPSKPLACGSSLSTGPWFCPP